jgi:hypothetical protein
VRIEVLQGAARETTLAIPPGLVVNYVNGSLVADWARTGDLLRVRLLDPVLTDASFVVVAELRAPREGDVAVPIVRVPAAERETGGIAVDVVGAGEITGRQARGLDPADPSELGESISGHESPSMVAFRLRPMSGTDARSLSVSVVRYTPQAVLIANVEEARYRALASADGRVLVEARFAVRNNQRGFLKASLPGGTTLWSTTVAGRPVRPGRAERDAILLPLEKGRAGEDAPTFLVELVYLQDAAPWSNKGRVRLDLPILDLPVSRTGIEMRYPPGFDVDAVPSDWFRVETDPGPFSAALRQVPAGAGMAAGTPPASPANGLQALADQFRRDTAGRGVAGALPVRVTFPEFGPIVFLAGELTAEGQARAIELSYKHAR